MRDIAAGDGDAAGRLPWTEAGRELDRWLRDRFFSQKKPSEWVPRIQAIEAEARQRGRERVAELEAALREIVALVPHGDEGPGPAWLRRLNIARNAKVAAALRALASADGQPEPGIDAERLTKRLHNDPALCRKLSPNGHPRWMAMPLCRSIAARLSADGDSPGGAE